MVILPPTLLAAERGVELEGNTRIKKKPLYSYTRVILADVHRKNDTERGSTDNATARYINQEEER